jgi:hypothetical protein
MRHDFRGMIARLRGAGVALAVLAALAGCANGPIVVSAPQLVGSSQGPDLSWNFCDGGDPAADYNCSGRGN